METSSQYLLSERLRKGEKREAAPYNKRTATSKDKKDGAKRGILKAAKKSGLTQDGIICKLRRGKELQDVQDPSPALPLNTDEMPPSAGAPPAEAPIIVTGPESFTYHKVLGQGGFGKVLLASHPNCQKQLAVKAVKKRLLLQDFRDNILIERQVLEITGESPLFSHAYATFQTQDYVFYVMEFLSRGNLTDLIRDKAPFAAPVTRCFAAEITCGLQFLHTGGIIHRDIKPDNLLLDSAGHLKIADFGLAVMNVFGDKMISTIAGSLAYMAPEILLSQPYNAAVDWFSAGIVLYQMATGRYPFNAYTSKIKLVESLIKDDPSYPEGLDSRARDIMEGLLNKSPERRQVAVHNIREHPFFMDIDWTQIEGGEARPPLQLEPPPVVTSEIMDNAVFSPEADESPMDKKDQKLFYGFTFASARWQVIKPEDPNSQHCSALGRMRKAFRRIWRGIRFWK